MTTNQYKVYSHNNGKLVVVTIFLKGEYKAALEECQAQQELFTLMNPESTFKCFVTDISKKEIIVAEADKGDLDKWTNLRDVTSSVNIRNQAKRKNNTSGKTGVAWNKREGKWHAYIYADGKCKTLGYFDYKEDAIFARMTAEKNLGFWVDKVCEVD